MTEYQPSARQFSATENPYGWAWELIDGAYAMTQLKWEPEAISDARVIMLFESAEAAEFWAERRNETGKAVLFVAK